MPSNKLCYPDLKCEKKKKYLILMPDLFGKAVHNTKEFPRLLFF